MKEQENLPVPVKSNLPMQMKKVATKTGKIIGYALATTGLVLTGAALPVLMLPATLAGVYTAQKLLNQTIYKSYPDLAFITKKTRKNTKIYQDVLRPDILGELRGLSPVEKAGFLQLQAIVGLSKMDGRDKKGNQITFETDSHGIVRKTFKTLADLGYIENYQETFLKKRNLLLPKLAFGNTKGLTEKAEIYNIQFQRTDKSVDMEDAKLRRLFPAIFSSRRGLLSKRNYQIVMKPDGTLEIDYKAQTSYIQRKTNPRENLVKELRKGAPSLEEQKEAVKEMQGKETQGKETQGKVEKQKER